MNGRLIVWLLVIVAHTAAVALPSNSPHANNSNDESSSKSKNMKNNNNDSKQLLVRETSGRKIRNWIEPVKGLKLDYDNNALLIKYSPLSKLFFSLSYVFQALECRFINSFLKYTQLYVYLSTSSIDFRLLIYLFIYSFSTSIFFTKGRKKFNVINRSQHCQF